MENGRPAQVSAVRRFNRFYTRQAGVLGRRFLDSPFSLTEVRVLYEIAARERTTAAEIRRELSLDAGYLSRLLGVLHEKKLIAREPSPADGRESLLRLATRGKQVFGTLDKRQAAVVDEVLVRLPEPSRRTLVSAMNTIEALLGAPAPAAPFVLRPPRPGDMGWVTHRQGVLYNQEYGWNEQFEATVARIVADFVEQQDPARERCWIAEREGEVVGSIFCVRKTRKVAKLRLLYVEPTARGLGIGGRLVDECIAFARSAGYDRLTLWTNDVLHSARKLYQAAGFVLVAEEAHHSWGHDLTSQTWDLALRGATSVS
jgi:DNA-binding MarR family transcriptional regulator/GNAT superfamily N-acetyltransferase